MTHLTGFLDELRGVVTDPGGNVLAVVEHVGQVRTMRNGKGANEGNPVAPIVARDGDGSRYRGLAYLRSCRVALCRLADS